MVYIKRFDNLLQMGFVPIIFNLDKMFPFKH